MRKIGIYLLIGTVLTGLITSCLKGNDYSEPTREEEQLNLNKYLNNIITNKFDVDTTELGVYYVTLKEGTGEFPKSGDTLTVGYAGYFPDGYLFDASSWHNQNDSTLTFVLGNPPFIKGWDDGMKVINKNATVELIIPSDFAYGSTGAGVIPPYQTLVFVVIMKDIKPTK
jgi:FKBP-type peptidyl-prolyl cis-trans isomerase FkpA